MKYKFSTAQWTALSESQRRQILEEGPVGTRLGERHYVGDCAKLSCRGSIDPARRMINKFTGTCLPCGSDDLYM